MPKNVKVDEEKIRKLGTLLSLGTKGELALYRLFNSLETAIEKRFLEFLTEKEKEIDNLVRNVKKGDRGERGEKGDKGDKPVFGVDYKIREPKNGKDGLDGRDGRNPNPLEVVPLVLQKLPKPKDWEPTINELWGVIRELQEELKKTKKVAKSSGGGGTTIFGSVGHSPVHETFTMNGSDTFVTLRKGVAAQGTAIMVRYQGQMLDLTSQYTVNGNKVTFVGFVPEADTIISVTYWG